MQAPIEQLRLMPPLPAESLDADETIIDHYGQLLESIARPITDEEATVLIELFGEDDCFGLAWTLVHILETAPGWPLQACLADRDGVWIDHLRSRVIAFTSASPCRI